MFCAGTLTTGEGACDVSILILSLHLYGYVNRKYYRLIFDVEGKYLLRIPNLCILGNSSC